RLAGVHRRERAVVLCAAAVLGAQLRELLQRRQREARAALGEREVAEAEPRLRVLRLDARRLVQERVRALLVSAQLLCERLDEEWLDRERIHRACALRERDRVRRAVERALGVARPAAAE